MTCKDCIHKSVCYRVDSIQSDYARKCGNFVSGCKALEQASVLDNIRAELHATAEMHEDGDYYLREKWIDEIIDKYKAGSEEKA